MALAMADFKSAQKIPVWKNERRICCGFARAMLFGVIFGDCITRRLHDHREIPKDRWNRQSAARHTAQAMPGVREGGRLCVCRHYVVTGGFLRKKNEQSANMKCGTNRAGLPRVATGAWAVDSLSSDNDGQRDLLVSGVRRRPQWVIASGAIISPIAGAGARVRGRKTRPKSRHAL